MLSSSPDWTVEEKRLPPGRWLNEAPWWSGGVVERLLLSIICHSLAALPSGASPRDSRAQTAVCLSETRTHTHINARTHTHAYKRVHITRARTHVQAQTSARRTHKRAHTHKCAHTRASTLVRTAHTQTRPHAYTQTHTNRQLWSSTIRLRSVLFTFCLFLRCVCECM